jgi:hypothetical protein
MDRRHIFTGAYLLALMLTVAIFSSPAGAEVGTSYSKAGYNPAATYPGPFVPNVVYYRPTPRGGWQRGLKGLYSKGVSCSDALRSFRRSGLWQGHFNPDGSCGPLGEPSEFALGNRLNFDAEARAPK